ncbi:WYL domain-containing protein [Flammeovirga yaeyamensis]|uniref:WYL domain-containing protein n=1 Tax=Flammeovirga yaeyamensis TaxID=367791 RepID=A0AAX1MZ11_9BACT|nr:WYL domain-containing protein [Flammeovirga yaeyamensis]MBB3695965.1 putative DNA-binding transcriptional regulator YafY [Flammeovirga yaeyamensis]NMF34652.1 WYL domain-containing protein [Flammeovirga yaeyamensis]QWG00519.1 WYL domain-containing protein [Flammeovirga yaeyamensis]
MTNTKKHLHRILDIIRLLNTNGITLNEYKEKFAKSRNQFLNDRRLIEDIFFPLVTIYEKKEGKFNRYLFTRNEVATPLFNSIDKQLINEQITKIKDIDFSAYKRIYKNLDFLINNSILLPDEGYSILEKIEYAIKNNLRIHLYNYSSTHRSKVDDFILEPIEFTPGRKMLYALDVDSKRCKTFKISRIDSIEVSNDSFSKKGLHIKKFHDLFGFSCIEEEKKHVSFSMNKIAFLLLCEEFPYAKNKITQNTEGEYKFEDNVANYKGVGRFVLGMIDLITDIRPIEFQDYLKNVVKESLFFDAQ